MQTQTAHFTFGLMSALVIYIQRKEYDHIGNQMSLLTPDVLNNTKRINRIRSALCSHSASIPSSGMIL